MLHELAHIIHGPHDDKFHALWNQLRDEHEGLARKGYTGEGFLSEGHRLGGSGRRLPPHEARRLARAAAEKRRVQSAGSGQRLGGAAPRPGQDIRNVIASAIERRNRSLRGCGNANHNEREIREISDQATRNGFRTKAEEDAANDAAVAQAIWDLFQEDEKEKYGKSYIPPSAQNPTGNGGGTIVVDDDQRSGGQGSSSKSATPNPSRSSVPAVPVATKPTTRPESPTRTETEGEVVTWTCQICTLVNRPEFLCCEACGIERSSEVSMELSKKLDNKRPRPRQVIDLTGSSPVRSTTQKRGASSGPSQSSTPTPTAVPQTWECSFCGNTMDKQWWTCSSCYKMKDSS